MKILHVTNTLSEGGVESFLLQLLSQLVQHGCEVDVLVLNKIRLHYVRSSRSMEYGFSRARQEVRTVRSIFVASENI